MSLRDNVAFIIDSNGEIILEIGPVAFEFIHRKHTNISSI